MALAIGAALLGAVLVAVVAFVDVTVIDPRITVRWGPEIGSEHRLMLERRYQLRNPSLEEGTTWRYQLGDFSRANIRALIEDPAVDDTGYIDRDNLKAERPDLRVRIRRLPGLPFPFNTTNEFTDARELFRVQSGWVLLGGGVILWTASAATRRRRRNLTVAMLLLVAVTAYACPISPLVVRMSDANRSVQNRGNFEQYAGVQAVRFHAHLTYAILGQLDRLFGQTDEAPLQAQTTLARAATAGFVLSTMGIGFLEGWSPVVLRYLALALLAPSALMYFGWREFGYLALNIAAFPLVARALRDGKGVEAGSILCGLGAALHGWGLVGLAGAGMAALAAPARLADRVARVLLIAVWGTAAYLGWVAIYIIILKLPIIPGHESAIPWRPWFVDQVFDGRLNPALFSAVGARDLFMTAWVVGAPLVVVAVSLWRRYGDEVRTALAYALPSAIVTLLVYHTQGLKEDMDVVFAVFPALYALGWVCARDPRRTMIAATLLVSGHLAFWRIVLDPQFASITVR